MPGALMHLIPFYDLQKMKEQRQKSHHVANLRK